MEADYIVQNHGSIFLFAPQNDAARVNLEDSVQEGAQFFGRALVVEHRYARDLATQLQQEGWVVR